MFRYPFGPVYGGSNYNAATGAESRDLRPLSMDDPRYGQRVPGVMGGMGGGMRPTNRLPPGYGREPVIMDGDGSYGPVPETGGNTPLPSADSSPVTFSTRPFPVRDSAQQFQQGRSPDRLAQKEADRQMQNITWEDPNSSIQRIPGTMDYYHKDPITGHISRNTDSLNFVPEDPSRPDPRRDTGPTNMPSRQPGQGRFPDPFGGGFGQQMNPFMGGGYGQQMNPFMGGGGFNPFMGGGFGGGYGQQMNPFMGGGGFNPFMGGGYGGGFGGGFGQQMNPFMGGGFRGGFGQQMNPFMGGGFGGYNQQPQAMPYNQQVSQPANPFRNFGGF